MVNYRFFGRKNGWVGGADVKYFHSHEIVDELNETSIFIDWNGKQILNLEKTMALFSVEGSFDKHNSLEYGLTKYKMGYHYFPFPDHTNLSR